MTATFHAPVDAVAGCELCSQPGGQLAWAHDAWRVVRVDDDNFPGFYRLIHQHHVSELSVLSINARQRCLQLLCAVEVVLLSKLRPTKVNLASLGNVVPHLHWHVIARFDWDSHFPQPIWGTRQREVNPPAASRLPCSLDELDASVVAALNAA